MGNKEVGENHDWPMEEVIREAFGQKMGLDCQAHIGFIMRRGVAISESAMANHVVIDSDMKKGRFHRETGDLLCRRKHTLGEGTLGITGRGDWLDPEARWRFEQVTCPKCSDMLKRLNNIA